MPQIIPAIVAGAATALSFITPIITGLGSVLTQLGFGLLSGLVSNIFGPKTESVEAAAADDLALSPSAEGPMVPIVFGRGVILCNLIRYEKGSYFYKALTVKVKKLFSSEKITTGRRDFSSFEVAVCLGSVDVIDEIIMMPTSENVLSTPIVFGENEDKRTVYLKSKSGQQKGYVDVYRGSYTQVRGSDYYSTKWGTDGVTSSKPALAYKNVCFAVFKSFECGQTSPGGAGVPIPTFKFKVRKYPKNLNVEGMQLQGSNNMNSESELDTNPAAIAYEALTSELIGPQAPDSLLNIPSFVRASQVFADYNQGMSLVINSQTSVKDFFAALKNNVRMLSYWDGWQVILRSYYDNDAFYNNIRTLSVEDLDSVDLQLGTVDGTVNVVKVRYLDIDSNSKQSVATRQNLSNIGIQEGRRISVEVDGRGLTNAEAANRLAEIVLQEGSYPTSSVAIKGNMSLASIAPMDVLAIKWNFNGDNVVLYVRVGDVKPDRVRQEVTINAIQDPNLNPEISEDIATTAPVPSWSKITDLKSTDRKPAEEEELGALPFTIVGAFELPPQITGRSTAATVPLYQPRQSNVISAEIYTQVDEGVATYAGTFYISAISGYFVDEIPENGLDIIETPISVILSEPDLDGSNLVAGAQVVTSPDDDNFTDLIDSKASIIIVGDEIMAVGLVEESEGNYTMSYVMRGLYGTKKRTHAAGTRWFWYEDAESVLQSGLSISENVGEQVKVLSYPVTTNSTAVTAIPAYHRHEVNDLKYIEEGFLPMQPIYKDITSDGGQLYTLSLIPILAAKGAGISEELVTNIGDLNFEINEYDGSDLLLNSYLMNGTFVPGDNFSESGGIISKQLDISVGTTYLTITSISDGFRANEPLTITIP